MMAERLYSLDVLRGLDMFLLTVVGPLVMAANAFVSCLFSIFVMLAVMFLWRRVKLGARLDR